MTYSWLLTRGHNDLAVISLLQGPIACLLNDAAEIWICGLVPQFIGVSAVYQKVLNSWVLLKTSRVAGCMHFMTLT